MFKTSTITGAILILAATTAAAQDSQKLERVEITGSSIKRVDAETALPVTVVTREEIAKSGVQSTEELVAQLTSVSSAGGMSNAGVAGLATYGRSSISLRGLGDSRTLVLVNGRRLAVFAGSGGSVNVNSIPLSAVDRVEVLQDGASGVYGSDAIAGVVNFILRKNYSGLEATVGAGTPTRKGGGSNRKASVVGGFGDYDRDRFTVTASLSAEKETALFGKDRDYAKSDTFLPYYAGGGTETGRIEGVWNLHGQYTDIGEAGPNARSATNPYGISGTGYGNPSAAASKCADLGMVPRSGKGFVTGADAATQVQTAPNCGFDTGPFVGLIPERKYIGGTINLRAKVSNNAEFFSEYLYGRNVITNSIQPSPLRQAFYAGDTRFADERAKGNVVDPALLIFPSNPNYKFASDYLNSVGLGAMVGSPLAVSQRTFLVGPRVNQDTAKQDRIVAGFKGTLGDVDYEFAYTHNSSKTDGKLIDGFFSIFDLSKILNDPASNWNPWAPLGKQDDALQQKIATSKYIGPSISSSSSTSGIDGAISMSLFDLAGGPLSLAAGFNARQERYVLSPAEATQSGDISGLGGAIEPVDAKRNVWAVFGEVNAPITKQLEANLALRQDNYSDFGKTANSKASIRFQPMKEVLVRGSMGTGFRAPTLPDLYTPQQINTSEQFIDPKFPGNGAVQVTSLGGGNPDLKAEESRQRSIGVVVQPLRSLTVSLDYFRVKVKGMIFAPSAQEIVSGYRAGRAGYGDLVVVNGADEIITVKQLQANVGSVTTSGLDLEAKWRENVGPGRLDVSLNGTYMDKYDLITAGGELERSVNTIVRPDGAPLVAAATGVILRWKHNLSAGYTVGPWSATLTQRYYNGYEAAPDLDGNRFFVKGQSTYDMVASYSGIKDLKMTLGVRNLANRKPPLFINNGSQFQAGYDVFQEDPRGRFVYLSASYKFF